MNVSGERFLAAPRERVWRAMHDAATLAACIPGCEELRRPGPAEWEGRLTLARDGRADGFSVHATVSAQSFPQGWTLTIQAGWGEGELRVTLAAEEGGTLVLWRGRAVGHPDDDARLSAIAGHLRDEFFRRLAERLVQTAEPVLVRQPDERGDEAVPPVATSGTPHPGRVLAIGGALWLVVAILLFVAR